VVPADGRPRDAAGQVGLPAAARPEALGESRRRRLRRHLLLLDDEELVGRRARLIDGGSRSAAWATAVDAAVGLRGR
jgi:hypothetical protein